MWDELGIFTNNVLKDWLMCIISDLLCDVILVEHATFWMLGWDLRITVLDRVDWHEGCWLAKEIRAHSTTCLCGHRMPQQKKERTLYSHTAIPFQNTYKKWLASGKNSKQTRHLCVQHKNFWSLLNKSINIVNSKQNNN